MNDGAAKLSIHAFYQGFDGPFSPVGQGFDDDLYGLASIGFADPGFDGSPGFDRRQTVFNESIAMTTFIFPLLYTL